MLLIAIIFFIFAALTGTVLLSMILKNKPTYKPIVFIHGTLASIALIIMISYIALLHTDRLLIASFVFFVLTAVGGFTLFTFDVSDKKIPKKLAMMHPVGAAIGLILLIIYVVQKI